MASLNKYAPWALAITLALGGSCGVAQAAYVDVLDLPAEPSALAVHSALRDVVRAGERLVAVGPVGTSCIPTIRARTGARPACQSAPTSMPWRSQPPRKGGRQATMAWCCTVVMAV